LFGIHPDDAAGPGNNPLPNLTEDRRERTIRVHPESILPCTLRPPSRIQYYLEGAVGAGVVLPSNFRSPRLLASYPSHFARRIALAHEVPPLPYDYSALEPYIDAETMHLHHDKHHQAYVTALNGAIEKHPDLGKHSAEDLLRNLNSVPEDVRTIVRNNGGGHVNHSMFWAIMKPQGGGDPTGAVGDQIKKDFASFEDFKKQFNETTAKQFGSGWGWLIWDGKLKIVTTPNQDSPLSQGYYPILGNDVWEHAYYLKYNNRRPEYLAAWWNVVNWDEVNKRLAQAKK
jgi:superoxide dismutase, Fe-Mn family